jgi:hypothetical protein
MYLHVFYFNLLGWNDTTKGRCYSSVLVSSLVQIVTDVWYRYTGIVSVHIHNLLMVEKSLVLF